MLSWCEPAERIAGGDRPDHVALRGMGAGRDGIAMMALKLEVAIEARVSSELQGEAGDRDCVVDDDMADMHAINAHRFAGINVFPERAQ